MISEDVVLKVSGAYGQNVDLVRCFLNRCKDRIFISNDVIALYFLLDDYHLDMLRYGLFDITRGDVVFKLLGLSGSNVHFFGVVGSSRGVLSLRSFPAKSFSWFSRDLSKFVYFKRR